MERKEGRKKGRRGIVWLGTTKRPMCLKGSEEFWFAVEIL
jgi:hypothetical protein